MFVCACRYVAASVKFCDDLLEEVEALSASRGVVGAVEAK